MTIRSRCSAQQDVRALWREYGTEATAVFAKANPGKRQQPWWICGAPELGRWLGGKGVPCHVALNYLEHYELGVPDSWLQPDDVRYYRGMQGPLTDASDLDAFPFAPVDRNDLPVYESQASYLRRHALLLPGLKRLTDRDFEPERLDVFEDELDDWREQIEDVVDG